jgi:hypothetical protein
VDRLWRALATYRLNVRRPQRWNPVDVVVRYGCEMYLLRLHGHLIGVRAGRRMYILKPLHRHVENACGQHPTYEAPWEHHIRHQPPHKPGKDRLCRWPLISPNNLT